MPKPTFFNLPEDKRMRIINRAIEEFSAQPYHSASLSTIVTRAGISKGSIYQYFENKFDLYRWIVLDEIPRRKREWLKDYPPPDGLDFYGQLEHMIFVGIGFGFSLPHLNHLADTLFRPTADPQLNALRLDAQRMSRAGMRALIEQAQQQNALRSGLDPDLAAAFLESVMREGISTLTQQRTGLDFYAIFSEPNATERFPEAEQRRLARDIIDMVQFGLAGHPKPTQHQTG